MGTVTVIPTMQLPPPGVKSERKLKINLRMVSSAGTELAANYLDLAAYSRGAGKEVTAAVSVTSALDSNAVASLRQGGDVLLLMDSTTAFPAGFPLIAVDRDTGGYEGNWASALSWVRNDRGPFRGVCPDRRFGFESAGAEMPYAVRGVPSQHFGDVLAGLFIGWVHRHAGYVVQMKVGKGRLLVCALPLQRTAGVDPFSATLLSKLKGYVSSSECQPKLMWNP